MQTTAKKSGARPSEADGSKADDPEQSKRFLEAAKERGAATTEDEARKVVKKVVSSAKTLERK
jgi:hypothetical protein